MKRVAFLFLICLTVIVGLSLFLKGNYDTVTITANYMQYACGDENIDMNVRSVDDHKYDYILNKDIAPSVFFLEQEKLIDFVKDKTYKWQMEDDGSYLEDFKLTGHIEAGKNNSDCSSAVKFFVEKISYGQDHDYIEF